MALFEVFIPAKEAGFPNVTLQVDAQNWIGALTRGLKTIGEGQDAIANVMCDIKEDNSIHVTDVSTRRVFRLRELQPPTLTEVRAEPPTIPAAAPTPDTAPRSVSLPDAPPAAAAEPEPFAEAPAHGPGSQGGMRSAPKTLLEFRMPPPPDPEHLARLAEAPTAPSTRIQPPPPESPAPPAPELAPPPVAVPVMAPAPAVAADAAPAVAEVPTEPPRASVEPDTEPVMQPVSAPPVRDPPAPPVSVGAPPSIPAASAAAIAAAAPAVAAASEAASPPAAVRETPSPARELLASDTAKIPLDDVPATQAAKKPKKGKEGSRSAEAAAAPSPTPRGVPAPRPKRPSGQFTTAPLAQARAETKANKTDPAIGRIQPELSRRSVADAIAEVFDATQDLYLEPKLTPQKVADAMLDIALTHIPAESGTFYLADVNAPELTFTAVRGPKADQLKRSGMKVKVGQGIIGFCAQEGVCLLVTDIQKDPRYYSSIASAIGYQPKDTLCASAEKDGRLFGALQLINSEKGFDAAHMEVARYIGLTAAVLLDRIEG